MMKGDSLNGAIFSKFGSSTSKILEDMEAIDSFRKPMMWNKIKSNIMVKTMETSKLSLESKLS